MFDATDSSIGSVVEKLVEENQQRLYSFLRSMVATHLAMSRPFISETLIKALHYHAVAGLTYAPGEYRSSPVQDDERAQANGGLRSYPRYSTVPGLMEDLVHRTNRKWDEGEACSLGAFLLWRFHQIRPFLVGNRRTALAASYFIICVKRGGWLAPEPILPERLRSAPQPLNTLLETVHNGELEDEVDLSPVTSLLQEELAMQLSVAG